MGRRCNVHPVPHRAQVVAEVERVGRRLDAREHTRAGAARGLGGGRRRPAGSWSIHGRHSLRSRPPRRARAIRWRIPDDGAPVSVPQQLLDAAVPAAHRPVPSPGARPPRRLIARRTAEASAPKAASAVGVIVLALAVTAVQVVDRRRRLAGRRDLPGRRRATGWLVVEVFTVYDGLVTLLFPTLLACWAGGDLPVATAVSCRASTGSPRTSTTRAAALWIWLGWWVPVVALWFPYQVVRDIQPRPRDHAAGVARLVVGRWLGFQLVAAGHRRSTGRAPPRTRSTRTSWPRCRCWRRWRRPHSCSH